MGRPEEDVGTVIKPPVGRLGQKSPLLAQSCSHAGSRVGGEDAEDRNLNAGRLNKIHRLPEDVFSVVFVAEDKGPLDDDAVIVEDLDILFHPVRPDPRFVRGVEILLGDGFKPDEKIDAAGFCGELDQLKISCESDRSKTSPFYLQRDEGPKDFLRIKGIAADIVIHEKDRS